ncbi:hypothetical protein NCCP2222_29450 [Sporosarcina sp. NCCP-2222]|uniref:hypothetical protein n=1 Tax=Sporosarcina sp. NCCP-2222 TaxID=2935073 RepID=UPI00208D232B|nr:hypothetical protein [Sporosarcina sp. NCCP-2222]GKV56998.1 hypothetical protein NCCP2222_29450 [Sporosarcina sp. NCCP-2222]
MSLKPNALLIGISLQVLFFILFFGAILPKMNNIIGAIVCSIIGLLSLIIGIKSLKQHFQPVLSLIVIAIAILILLFTLYAYFTTEAGIPPAILR